MPSSATRTILTMVKSIEKYPLFTADSLAAETGRSVRQIYRYIDDLRDCGWIITGQAGAGYQFKGISNG